MVEFDVTITTKDMFDYNVYHNYRNFNGIMGVVLGIICLVLCVSGIMTDANISYILIMGLFGGFLTVFTPVQIYLRSVKQVKLTPSFRKPLHYKVDEQEISVSQDGAEAVFSLGDVWKAVDTGKAIVIYVTRIRAYIFPKRDLMEKEGMLLEVLKRGLSEQQYKIRQKRG